LFGTGFSKAASLGQLAIIAFIPLIIGTPLSAGILVGGRTLPLIFVGLVQAAVMIGIAYPLVDRLGLVGFFLAQAGAAFAAIVLWLLILGRQTRQAPLRPWMAPLTLATVALCAVLALDASTVEPAWLRLVAGAVGVPIFAVALAFAVLTATERRLLYDRAYSFARLAALRRRSSGD
jgi:O-antigen/teichoic acid export membrane protein